MSSLRIMGFAVALLASVQFSAAQPAGNSPFINQLLLSLNGHVGPLDVLYVNLSADYALCAVKYELADEIRDDDKKRETFSEARKCSSDMLTKGNASIAEMKAELAKGSAQSALNDLTVYWRTKMSEAGTIHGERVTSQIVRSIKMYIEKVKVEAE